MMRKKVKQVGAYFLVMLCLICISVPAEAAVSSSQKKTADSVDSFIGAVIIETYANMNGTGNHNATKKQFLKSLKKTYNGKLTTKVMSAIAASQTKGYKWSYNSYITPGEVGKVSASKVKKEYKNLFGKKISKINLPVRKSSKSLKGWYLDFAKNKSSSTVYWYSGYETDTNLTGKITGIKKAGSGKYTITKKYSFYKHWSHKKPDYTFTVKIKVKKNSKSSYQYNIIGLSIQ